jgi:endonuclease-3
VRKEKVCLEIIKALENEYPNARTRLNYNSVFELAIAVVLSAQSTDEQVNRVTADLFVKYRDAYEMAQADPEQLESDIRGVGLHRSKAKNVQKLARTLVEKYHGEIPDNFDQLLELPGVGRKSANVILAVGFDKPGLGVDTHVARLANRLGLVKTTIPKTIEMELKKLVPMAKWGKSHHLLISHGRQICKARKPECDRCILNELCPKLIEKS